MLLLRDHREEYRQARIELVSAHPVCGKPARSMRGYGMAQLIASGWRAGYPLNWEIA